MQRHDYRKESLLRDAVRARPTDAGAHAALGGLLLRAGRLAQAREALQAGLAVARDGGRLHHLLGLVLAGAGDYESALRHLERAAAREPTRFEFIRDLALVQGAAGRTAESVETLRQAAALGAEGARGLGWLLRLGERAASRSGAELARRPPQPTRRAAVVEQLIGRDPDVAEAIVAAHKRGADHDQEILRAARRALVRLAASHPSYPDIHFGLSLVAEQLGEIDRAIEAAERALAINPRYAEACLLAVRLYEKSGKWQEAEARCRRAAELRPDWPDAHIRLGQLLVAHDKPREAADAYRRALALNDRCDEARRGLAEAEAVLAGRGGAQ